MITISQVKELYNSLGFELKSIKKTKGKVVSHLVSKQTGANMFMNFDSFTQWARWVSDMAIVKEAV